MPARPPALPLSCFNALLFHFVRVHRKIDGEIQPLPNGDRAFSTGGGVGPGRSRSQPLPALTLSENHTRPLRGLLKRPIRKRSCEILTETDWTGRRDFQKEIGRRNC
jgi:hypothetical protein